MKNISLSTSSSDRGYFIFYVSFLSPTTITSHWREEYLGSFWFSFGRYAKNRTSWKSTSILWFEHFSWQHRLDILERFSEDNSMGFLLIRSFRLPIPTKKVLSQETSQDFLYQSSMFSQLSDSYFFCESSLPKTISHQGSSPTLVWESMGRLFFFSSFSIVQVICLARFHHIFHSINLLGVSLS